MQTGGWVQGRGVLCRQWGLGPRESQEVQPQEPDSSVTLKGRHVRRALVERSSHTFGFGRSGMAALMSTRGYRRLPPVRPHWFLVINSKGWVKGDAVANWRVQPHPRGRCAPSRGSASLDLLVFQEKLKIWTCKGNFLIFKCWKASDFLKTLNGQIKHICSPEKLPLGALSLGQRFHPGRFCPLGNIWQCLEIIFVVTACGGVGDAPGV